MNTDASDVEDMIIPEIKECLLLSCVAFFEEWSNIFRTRSFTLCKNHRDINGRSGSVAVLESISSSSMTNLSVCWVNKLAGCSFTGLSVLGCCSFHELRSNWLSYLVFPGLCHAVEASTSGVLSLHRDTKFIIGFDFSVILLLHLNIFAFFFDITSGQLVKLKRLMLKQTQKMIPFITCEISLCQYVCELVFGVNVFELDFRSKLILSNNQSRATLWVRETCLIVGLLPFMIILITLSLSSNTHNKASWREELTCEGIQSTLSKSLITTWDCFRFWSCEVLHEPHVVSHTSLTVLDYSDTCFH